MKASGKTDWMVVLAVVILHGVMAISLEVCMPSGAQAGDEEVGTVHASDAGTRLSSSMLSPVPLSSYLIPWTSLVDPLPSPR